MTPRFLWKLIFHSGPLAGQGLNLPNGDVTVGDTPECDVQLSLPKAPGQHCVLQVSEQGVRLRTLRVRCRMNGRRVKDEEVEVPAHQRIDLGGYGVSIVRAGEEMPLQPIKSRRYGIRLWGIALPGAMVTCLMAVMFQAGRDLRASVPNHSLFDLQGYQRALRMKFDQIRVDRDEMGVLTLTGRCDEAAELSPYLNTLIEAGIVYRNQVVCEDELQRSVAYILRGNGYRYAQVSSGQTPGSVIISGNISDDAQWVSVSQQLDQLPGLRSWTVRNDTDAMLVNLIDMLRQQKLFEQLSVACQGDILTVTGQVPEAQEPQLRQALERWQQGRGNEIRLIYQNIPATKFEAEIFPAQVVSFSGNQQAAFLKLANGMKIQAGSTLPNNGYMVTKLDQNGIELRKEGEWIHLPLGLQ